MDFPGRKILYITHDYSTFTKDQVELISPHFEKVNVLVRYKPIAELADFLPIPYFDPFKKENLINTKNLPSNIEVIPIPLYYLPFDSSYKQLGKKHLHAVKREIRRRGISFDLIHAHFTWTAGYVGMKLKEESGKPFILTGHGYDVYDLPFRDDVWRSSIRSVCNAADHVITVSGRNKDLMGSIGVTAPVSVIPNGFRADLFYPRDKESCRKTLGLPLDRKIVLTAGTLIEVKGQAYLIDAMDRVREERPDALCIIVGSGGLQHALSKQIVRKGLAKHVMLAGSKPHTEMPLWINACDLFVLPSLSEGNPTVMFECLGCGKPFVGTTVGGIPEIISSDDYGFIVESRNPDLLSDKILAALEKKWDRDRIYQYAGQFTWESITGRIRRQYEVLLRKDSDHIPARDLN